MHLKNTGARLITINTPKPLGKSFQVLPAGEAVEIPESAITGSVKSYIEGFINSGELIEVAAPKTERVSKAKQTEE